jgi:hypothetical protein
MRDERLDNGIGKYKMSDIRRKISGKDELGRMGIRNFE